MKNILAFKNISYTIDKHLILDNISFALAPKACYFLLGKNGAGKSTLLNLINGVLEPDQGKMYFLEEEIYGPSIELVPGRDGLSYVNQMSETEPFLSVAQNIKMEFKYVEGGFDSEKYEQIISSCLVEDLLEKRVKVLSGGEKQRVAIAKALVKEPQLMMLDEPFNHLDFEAKLKLKNVILNLKASNVTLLIVTHDLTDAQLLADEYLILKNKGIQNFKAFDFTEEETDAFADFQQCIQLDCGKVVPISQLRFSKDIENKAELIAQVKINQWSTKCLLCLNGQYFELTLPHEKVTKFMHFA